MSAEGLYRNSEIVTLTYLISSNLWTAQTVHNCFKPKVTKEINNDPFLYYMKTNNYFFLYHFKMGYLFTFSASFLN